MRQAKRQYFTRKRKESKDASFSRHYYRDSYKFFKVSYWEFVILFFSDACVRHPDSRLIVSEMVASESYVFPRTQEAHRVTNLDETTRIKGRNTHISPFLYKTGGKYKGKGIRLKKNVSVAVGIPLDFDSLESFAEADKKKDALKLPEWDFVCYTGGRGVQAWYDIDAFPLRTQKQIDFYENVRDSLVETLNSDKKAKLLTQLLRLPDTLHPRTGRKSEGYVRRDFQKDSIGKLLKIANILKANGLLKNKPRPKTERRRKGMKFESYRERIDERLKQGTMSGKYPDLALELSMPESSFKYLIYQYQRKGEIAVKRERKGQRNAGVTIERTTANKENPDKLNTIVHLYSEGLGHKEKLSKLYSEYLSQGSNVDYRNTVLFTLALWLCALRVNVNVAREKLRGGNLKSRVPLSENEFNRTFESAYSGKYEGVSSYWLSESLRGLGIVQAETQKEKKESSYFSRGGQIGQKARERVFHLDACDCKECCPELDFRVLDLSFGDTKADGISKSGNGPGEIFSQEKKRESGSFKRCSRCNRVKQRYEYFFLVRFPGRIIPDL